jgi:hypothetical protein
LGIPSISQNDSGDRARELDWGLAGPMALCHLHFVDHDDNICATENSEHDDDETAIEATTYRVSEPGLSLGSKAGLSADTTISMRGLLLKTNDPR